MKKEREFFDPLVAADIEWRSLGHPDAGLQVMMLSRDDESSDVTRLVRYDVGAQSRRRSSCPARSPQARTTLPTPDHPADRATAAEYEALYPKVGERLAALMPAGADVSAVAEAIVEVVDLPDGRRPSRTHIDPSDDGSAVVSAVADRVRTEFPRRIGLDDVVQPRPGRRAA